ncbi:hypothetical protein [Methylacidiphilum kamchatkense]|uniref:hypothetical protein n=1 Tax=Methylacidiphilum kamchatkense TaxID=431057 RepID=UPI001F21FE73|nr:hypothetical protein [Methylacidiphilum kamchatkense]
MIENNDNDSSPQAGNTQGSFENEPFTENTPDASPVLTEEEKKALKQKEKEEKKRLKKLEKEEKKRKEEEEKKKKETRKTRKKTRIIPLRLIIQQIKSLDPNEFTSSIEFCLLSGGTLILLKK